MAHETPNSPKLKVRIERIPSPAHEHSRFRWDVMLRAPDALGARMLEYRASGTMNASGSDLHFDRGVQVLDESRPVWTTMNASDRPDIRKRLSQLAREGLKMLDAEGGDLFEKAIR